MDSSKKEQLNSIMIEYGDELVRLAYTYVKNTETAKDLVQNTFIKCYEHMETFRYEASLRTWLYRITINECKDYLKSWHYKKVQLSSFFQDKTLLPSVEKSVLENESNLELKHLVFSLPKEYREVIYLYYYHSMKIDEISEVTNLSSNTIKTRLRRAKEKLKLKLKEAEVYG